MEKVPHESRLNLWECPFSGIKALSFSTGHERSARQSPTPARRTAPPKTQPGLLLVCDTCRRTTQHSGSRQGSLPMRPSSPRPVPSLAVSTTPFVSRVVPAMPPVSSSRNARAEACPSLPTLAGAPANPAWFFGSVRDTKSKETVKSHNWFAQRSARSGF